MCLLIMSESSELEQALDVVFRDKSLLQRALTHRSYLNEHPESAFEDNERLEFLGDAVLDFVTGEFLYHRFPEMAEGALTSLRSALVRRDTLARFARDLEMAEYLWLGHGEAESGGRERPALLCATFEAVIGAVYLDQGLEPVRRIVEQLIGPEVTHVLRDRSDKDAKSELQEVAQSLMHRTPRYITVAENGPDHAKEFTVEVSIGREVYGQGIGFSKQQAAQAAARAALDHLQALGLEGSSEEEPPLPLEIANDRKA